MGVRSGPSRVADLSFQVFGRVLHPDWFAVRAHQRLRQAGWEADLRIIDGGHAIAWSSGGVRLTEVLAGPATVLPEPGLLFHSPVRTERSTRLQPGGRTEYQTCFESERVAPEVFAHLNEEIALDALQGGLFHRFGRTNRLAPAPLSLLRIESRGRGLAVQAVHTFPDERAIVRVQSLFETLD